jgi:hypothetical protein
MPPLLLLLPNSANEPTPSKHLAALLLPATAGTPTTA